MLLTNADQQTQFFETHQPFQLESGHVLPGLRLAYNVLGQPNPDQDNIVWIFHALTANSRPDEWWPGLVGSRKLLDPNKHCIICINMPGSCYGSIGPFDIIPPSTIHHPSSTIQHPPSNIHHPPSHNQPYYHQFPLFTPRDMANAYKLLREELNIHRIALGIGGSMGGQQLLEWAILEPELFEHIVPIATNAFHSAWGRAFNASQRMCIEADPSWKEQHPDAGMEGMKVARSIALLSYRHYETYAATQQDEPEVLEHFRSESYQRYQGEKLALRFNAFSYHALTRAMDAHHVGRGRGSAEQALQKIRAKACVVGIDTDLLYPLQEQAFIARHIPGASLEVMESSYGHDGFLLEYAKLEKILRTFLSPHFF
jgi:homoserine O-acetyltransferase/O-succinyltransferase